MTTQITGQMSQQSGQAGALAPVPAEHPCARPFAFTLAIPSAISLKHKGSRSPEQRPERSEEVTAPLPQRHLPAEAPESAAQRLDGEGKGNIICHLLWSHPNRQPQELGASLQDKAGQK